MTGHLRQLPESVAGHLAAIVISNMPSMPNFVADALRSFADEPTVHNAGRLARELRYAGREGLAREIEDALSDD